MHSCIEILERTGEISILNLEQQKEQVVSQGEQKHASDVPFGKRANKRPQIAENENDVPLKKEQQNIPLPFL